VTALPTREEIAEIARIVAGLLSTFPKHANEHPENCLPEAEAVTNEILARLRPAWETPMNYTPTIDTIRRKMKGGSLFAEDEIVVLLKEIDALRAELEKVNNEFGSMTANWPNAWERVSALKESNRALRADLETTINQRDRAVEDLRACAEVLASFAYAPDDGESFIVTAGDVKKARATLARPGVQEALK